MLSQARLRRIYNYLLKSRPAPEPPAYKFPPTTAEELDYAELVVIDLAKAKTFEGRKELSGQLTKAMQGEGFFYVINHGYTQEQTDRIFSIGNLLFDNVDEEEKQEYTDKNPDVYEGYKVRKLWEITPGIYDAIEHYNIHHHVKKKQHPKALRPYLNDLDDFSRHEHFNVLNPLLRIMAIGLGLTEETLVKMHDWNASSQSSSRFMKYFPRSNDEEEKTKNVWLKGHTDEGSVTLLWSQPIGGLQILTKDGQWKWVRHMPNALVVNSGDALGFLCGGYYPPTRHRVVQPPKDQQAMPRLGAFYFAMPSDEVKLAPLRKESPVLRDQWDIKPEYDPVEPPTMETWRRERTRTYGQVKLQPGKEKGVEEEIVAGVVVKHYN